MQTVEEDESELFADIVEKKALVPPISNNLCQTMQNVQQTNIVPEKINKILRESKKNQ